MFIFIKMFYRNYKLGLADIQNQITLSRIRSITLDREALITENVDHSRRFDTCLQVFYHLCWRFDSHTNFLWPKVDPKHHSRWTPLLGSILWEFYHQESFLSTVACFLLRVEDYTNKFFNVIHCSLFSGRNKAVLYVEEKIWGKKGIKQAQVKVTSSD